MKAKIKCENCNVEILFSKNDVRKLTSKEQKNLKKNNKVWQDKLDETTEITTGFFIKKKHKEYAWKNYPEIGLNFRINFRNRIIDPIGIVKCPICNYDQMIKK